MKADNLADCGETDAWLNTEERRRWNMISEAERSGTEVSGFTKIRVDRKSKMLKSKLHSFL